jgi:uncharacterized protein
MRTVYLHGFASSPGSSKARYFRDRFAELGIPLEIPQLDEGDFSKLTLTGQLRVIERTVRGESATLIGSSMGGYLAAWYASRHPEIGRVVLMAPAFQFPDRWRERVSPEERAAWRQNGFVRIFHYGAGEERPLGYQFMEDLEGYENEPDLKQPALLFHGRHDAVVPIEVSRSYASRHPNVALQEFESGHELTDVLGRMWDLARAFLLFQKP